MRLQIDQRFDVRYEYPVCFTRGAFDPDNLLLRDLITNRNARSARVLMVVDEGVTRGNPQLVRSMESYASTHADAIQLVRSPWIVRGGEVIKNDPLEVNALYEYSRTLGLCRHSYVVALGGGAMLDAVGYAAATAHRGIRLIRMPSTVLGQNDAGVGVKNAINWQGRKNFLGTFVPPYAVVNDFALLASVPVADRRAGIAEAVKVALIRDRGFFEYMQTHHRELARLDAAALEEVIVRCASLHLAHIRDGGDPFERGSQRPLDFGHWSAHRLEEISQGRLRHGEAVAIGVALDALYSFRSGMLSQSEWHAVYAILTDIGFTLNDAGFARLDVAKALNDFREHLGGELCITLLRGIGRGVEVDTIDVPLMSRCIEELRELDSARTAAGLRILA
ncbi:3-dehydroquinate synthase [Povalibacter uvarum]|uniref:3-dehydroquinate synthase n=1 Tax=Povalibacter uvarum TaxID=732238 RepID=A0A841HKU6_9GAMM|nr:3-dehydroquinate synthase [Povalibacter uvarum]MBB6093476.1 3-dehydroquinate synthase [Povalibacter uvarum]